MPDDACTALPLVLADAHEDAPSLFAERVGVVLAVVPLLALLAGARRVVAGACRPALLDSVCELQEDACDVPPLVVLEAVAVVRDSCCAWVPEAAVVVSVFPEVEPEALR